MKDFFLATKNRICTFFQKAYSQTSWKVLLGIFLFVFVLFLFEPLPALNGVEPSDDSLKSLITWGLSRQLTHASLTLAALVGLFSMLRMRPKILQKCATKVAFTGFLAFLSYEYTKLIRSVQIISFWESKLHVDSRIKNLFPLDLLQSIFLSNSTNYIILTTIQAIQSLGMAFIIVLLIKIYSHSSQSDPYHEF